METTTRVKVTGGRINMSQVELKNAVESLLINPKYGDIMSEFMTRVSTKFNIFTYIHRMFTGQELDVGRGEDGIYVFVYKTHDHCALKQIYDFWDSISSHMKDDGSFIELESENGEKWKLEFHDGAIRPYREERSYIETDIFDEQFYEQDDPKRFYTCDFHVKFHVTGDAIVTVRAKSMEEAKQKANSEMEEYPCGDLDDISWEFDRIIGSNFL